ncbi:MAG: DUF1129 domain-containing protein [Planctomycetes bacterium]|nr:DUF1129 domain-containing protein [Planctomycetota bacterium]
MPIPRFVRHPLCPECRYDLIATVDAGGSVCPECGCAFERHELLHEVRPGDWTVGRGMRRVAVFLLVRGIVCALFWTAIVAGLSALAVAFDAVPKATRWGIELVCGLTIIATGASIGYFMAKDTAERAGFAGMALASLTVFAAWTVIFVSVTAVELMGLVGLGSGAMLMCVTGLVSAGWIVKVLLIDEV